MNKIVAQANPLIEARYEFSTIQNKLIRHIISMIDRNGTELKNPYIFSIEQFLSLIEVDRKEHLAENFRQVTNGILDTKIYFRKKHSHLNLVFFTSINYEEETDLIKVTINPELRYFLLNLNENPFGFTSYQFENILNLKGKYTVRIFELMKQYFRIKRRLISVNELKEILNINESYEGFHNFKNQVLKPSLEQINKFTELNVSFTTLKKSRNVVALDFNIEEKNRIKKLNNSNNDPILEQLLSFGITKKVASQIVKEYPKEKIKFSIDLYIESSKTNNIRNKSGWIIKCIQNNYNNNSTSDTKIKNKQLVEDSIENNNYMEDKINEFIISLNEEELKKLQNEFINQTEDKIVISSFQKNGFESAIVNGNFRFYIKRKLQD